MSLFQKKNEEDHEDGEDVVVQSLVSPPAEYTKTRIELMGGFVVFAYKMFRLIGCVVLAGLTIVTLVPDTQGRSGNFMDLFVKNVVGSDEAKFSGTLAICLTYVRFTPLFFEEDHFLIV